MASLSSATSFTSKCVVSFGSSSEEARLRGKYVAKLADEEEQIERLRAEIAELKAQIESEKEAIAKLIEKLQLPS